MPGSLNRTPGRVVIVALAILACGTLVIESPFLRRGYRLPPEDWPAPGADVRVPRLADTVLVRGVIRSTLYEAVRAAGWRALPRAGTTELTWRLADVFDYRVDMSRDLEPGDEVRALVERALRPDGSVYASELLAARLTLSGSRIEAVRHRRGRYVDRYGRSLRATFLRAPLNFRRLSSGFGFRRHPILGIWRAHRGIDYAAPSGTPVRSVGDGVVAFAGRLGSYGNLVEIRHVGGVVTRYAHLRSYARAARPGRRVRVGETVGYVGSTGLSTGPHLHFEMLINGRYADPRQALNAMAAASPRFAGRTRYDPRRTALLAALGS
jgi:murein DD-endopeptidase MepM/ murein hydrolase activator NlpD